MNSPASRIGPRLRRRSCFRTRGTSRAALAKKTGRRILAYFTSDWCGWCRVLEKRTFTDQEVVALSKQFVCVEVNTHREENLRIADEYRIDTIPRTYIFTPDGRIIDRRTGYVPATEYAAWLKGAGNDPPPAAPEAGKAVAPAAVGAPAGAADVVIWFVDADREIARWSDRDWTSHAHMLRLLHAAGVEARVEHIARDELPARWDAAVARGQVPDLISAQQWAGLIKQLETGGRLRRVQSERLTWLPESAACSDFKGRWLFLVNEPEHPIRARQAMEELLRPAPEMVLAGKELPDRAGRDEAAQIARRAVAAYFSGDAEGVKRVAASNSPQLSRCTRAQPDRREWKVDTGAIELRGNDAIAFTKVEMRFEGPRRLGAEACLVVLVREASQWKAFSISSDPHSVRALRELCGLQFRAVAGPHASPPVPELLHPADGSPIGQQGKSFAWDIPAAGEPLACRSAKSCWTTRIARGRPHGSRSSAVSREFGCCSRPTPRKTSRA